MTVFIFFFPYLWCIPPQKTKELSLENGCLSGTRITDSLKVICMTSLNLSGSLCVQDPSESLCLNPSLEPTPEEFTRTERQELREAVIRVILRANHGYDSLLWIYWIRDVFCKNIKYKSKYNVYGTKWTKWLFRLVLFDICQASLNSSLSWAYTHKAHWCNMQTNCVMHLWYLHFLYLHFWIW